MEKCKFPQARIMRPAMLGREMKRLSDQSVRFCFILGSGASVESGIPSGQKMEKIWMDYIMSHNTEDFRTLAAALLNDKEIKTSFDELEKAWAAANEAETKGEWLPIPSSYYFDIYKLRYFTFPLDGYRYLESVMDDKAPSLGYHALARILTNTNQHNLVITTNFDSLTEDAVFLYSPSKKRPLVVSHESLASYVELDAKRPVVAKVHRDAMCHPFNEQENTNALKDQWRTTLNKVFGSYVPVVVGYEGGDQSLMAFLKEFADLGRGIYWCYWEPGGNCPSKDIRDFLVEKKGFLVPIPGFDGLMIELYNALFPDDPFTPSSAQAHLKQQYDNRYKLYDDRWKEFKKNPHYKDIADRIDEQEENSRQEREETNTQTSWDYIRRGDQLAEEGRYEEALAEYEKAIQTDPTNAAAYYNRGLTHQNKDDFQKAIEDYDRAIQLNPNHTAAYNNRGNAYSDMDKLQEALDDYDRAIQLNPNYAMAYYNRGNAYSDMGKFQEALDDHDQAIRLNPNDPDAYNNRGYNYVKWGKYDEALADCTKAIELDPYNAPAYDSLGEVYLHLKRYEEAIENYTKAIEIPPPHSLKTADLKNALLNRAKAYRAIGEIEKAEADEARANSL